MNHNSSRGRLKKRAMAVTRMTEMPTSQARSGHARAPSRVLAHLGAMDSWPLAWRLGIALVACALAVALRAAFLGALEGRLVYVTFFPAVAASALIGGFSGGLLAMALCGLFAHLFIAPIAQSADVLGLLAFMLSCAIIVAMADLLRQARVQIANAEAVRQSEAGLMVFVDQAPAAIAMFDLDMRYLAASARWRNEYRLPADIIGLPHYNVFPDIPERWKDINTRALAGEVVQSDDEELRRADGAIQWFRREVRPWHHPRDGIGGIVIFSEDITARKMAEADAKASAERFQLIAQATNDAIWDWDLKSGNVWWNDGLKRMFGYEPADFARGPDAWMSHVHPDDRALADQSHIPLFNGDIPSWENEYRFIRSDESVATVAVRGAVVRDDTGRAIRVFGSIQDVTTRRELDAQLRQSQKLEAVGQLTGGVAHDFNNLLTVIIGNAEALVGRLSDDKQLRVLAQMIETAADRGAELTKRLLAFARRQPLEPRAVQVDKLIAGLDGLLRRTLSEDIEIEIVGRAGLWQAVIDPGQLESAILNLAINARDAMPGGGRLTIETANTALDTAYARAHDEVTPGQYVLMSISDTGHGMDASTIARAFEPFYTTKEVGKGSGLGLSMVYGFIKQSSGHINIYSEPGHGTTVKLYLPRAPDGAHAEIEEAETSAPPDGNERILVVEDDDLVREFVSELLGSLGYRTIGARGGADALQILKSEPDIDLLFTDVVMPGGMNGRQLADKSREIRPDLRVLFTSGYTENAIVHHGRLDRGVLLLSKPYRRRDLALKVRQALDEQAR